jgi:hypothetical protein
MTIMHIALMACDHEECKAVARLGEEHPGWTETRWAWGARHWCPAHTPAKAKKKLAKVARVVKENE